MINRRKYIKQLGLGAILLLSSISLNAQNKKLVEAQYKNKFVVVLKEGLAVGLCSEAQPNWPSLPKPVLTVTVNNGVAVYHEQHESAYAMSGCSIVTPEPIHKGEVLRVESAKIQTVLMQGRQFGLLVMNVSPHAVERGVGALAHQSDERGWAYIVFKLDEKDNKKEAIQAASYASDWFKVFDSQNDAASFGNTASGVFVKQIKVGMTIAEVESVFGAPETRIDLTDKILYKYKDMTVEFREGKVTDVR
jgi:hypothetical protein